MLRSLRAGRSTSSSPHPELQAPQAVRRTSAYAVTRTSGAMRSAHSASSQSSPYERMSSMIGNSARPFSVSAYSTRGGTSGKVWRSTISCSSSARNRSDSVRGLMPASERSSSQKRDVPSARSRTSSRVHFPHTISAVLHTGHVSSTAISTDTLPTEVASGRGRRPWARLRGDGDRLRLDFGLAVILGGGHVLHRRSLAPIRLHQQLEVVRAGCDLHRVLERHPPRLDVAEQRLVEGLHAVVAARGDHLDQLAGLRR